MPVCLDQFEPTADFIKRVKTSKAGAGQSLIGGLHCGRIPRELVNKILNTIV